MGTLGLNVSFFSLTQMLWFSTNWVYCTVAEVLQDVQEQNVYLRYEKTAHKLR